MDTAYVMFDPSMDKQESYVATSRTREKTHLYATPEIEGEQSEYAPGGPERDPIAHLGEAVERDRAQTAAHDEALRAELAKLPTVELAARRDELGTPARFEAQHQESYARQVRAVEERRGQVEQATADREAVEALGWRERRQKLPYATEREQLLTERLAEERVRLAQMEPPTTEVWRECEIATQLLDARSAQALTAARIEPPAYIVKELGERPTDPAKARAWDRGVQGVERYRLEHGVKDKGSAFGRSRRTPWRGRRRKPRSGGLPRHSAGSGLSSSGSRPGSRPGASSGVSASAGSAPTRSIEAPRSRV